MMRVKFLIVASILSLSLLNGCASDFSEGGSKVSSADESSETGADKNDATGAGEYKYDIEKAFPEDESLKEILEGKTMPVSVTYGLGGEGGYEQFTSKDPELISELITTFREMKIQEEVTDRDKMIFFDDAIEDYIFVLDNGVQVMVTLDAGYVAYGENVQYLFESSKGLTKFKNEIRESGSAEDEVAKYLDDFLAGDVEAYNAFTSEHFYITDLKMDSQDEDSYSVGDRIDLDNDGIEELILSGPNGGMYLDVLDTQVAVFAMGDGTSFDLSYAEYDSAIWIIYSDTTHVGRKSYSLTKYNGIDKVVDAFDINCEYQGDNYDENSDFHIRDEKVTMEEFEKIMMELFD